MKLRNLSIGLAVSFAIAFGFGIPAFQNLTFADSFNLPTKAESNKKNDSGEPSISGSDENVSVEYGSTVSFIDTIKYTNLEVGQIYTIKGTLYELVTDEEGNQSVLDTGITNSRIFAVTENSTEPAETSSVPGTGVIKMQFSIDDLSSMIGKRYVVFETIKSGGITLCELNNLDDTSRYVSIPFFDTTVVDSENGTQVAIAGVGTSAKAVINYDNLTVGKEYQINACLVQDGTLIKNTLDTPVILIPEKSNGQIELTIPYIIQNSGTLRLCYYVTTQNDGEKGVSLDTLYAHDDVNDENSKLHLAEFKFSISDSKTRTALSEYSKTATSLLQLSYSNLPAGELTFSSSLYDAKTNKVIKNSDGKPCTKDEVIDITLASSIITSEHSFNSTSLAGHQLYSRSSIKINGKTIFTIDENTENNRIYIASVTSKSLAFESGSHKANLDKPSEYIIDTIGFSNLIAGNSYSVESNLINSKTKKSVALCPQKSFRVSESTGEYSVTLNPISYANVRGITVHSHVKLYMNGVLVASSNSVPKKYTGISYPKPTSTPKPTKKPTPKPTKKPTKAPTPKPTRRVTPKPTKKPANTSYVWLPATGKKYHLRNNCGTMDPKKATQVSLSEARRRGYEPCKKCF